MQRERKMMQVLLNFLGVKTTLRVFGIAAELANRSLAKEDVPQSSIQDIP